MFEQIELTYRFYDLEPHIDAVTVETHYTKHHATYTKNFNELVAKSDKLKEKSAKEILSNLQKAPEELRQGLRNNGGGYFNHNLYFEQLSPKGGGDPEDKELADRIRTDFGTVGALREAVTKAGVGQFGSGYAWLVCDEDGRLMVTATPNQDSPLQDGCQNLLICLDVWEHAYYLKYKNLRADYIEGFWQVLDWDVVARRYEHRQ